VAFRRVSGLSSIATCSSGTQAVIDDRLLPYFFAVGLPAPTKDAIEAVFASRIMGSLQSWPAKPEFLKEASSKLVSATIQVLGSHQSMFLASQVFPQSQAGLSDLFRITQRVCNFAAAEHDRMARRLQTTAHIDEDRTVRQFVIPPSATLSAGARIGMGAEDAAETDSMQLSTSILPSLWVHEVCRELADRLASEAAVARMHVLVKSIAERDFGMQFANSGEDHDISEVLVDAL